MQCDKNPHKIMKMFDEIALYYDNMNNFISVGTHFFIKYIAIKQLCVFSEAEILDICCGTGDFTKIISSICPSAKVIGVDFSQNMLQQAMKKNPHKTFTQADCTNLPFNQEEFDFVTMGFGLRNIQDRTKAIEEVFRVLKSGGKFLQLDFGYHNKISSIFNLLVPYLVKVMKKNSAHYNYLLSSKETFPEPEELICEFKSVGFNLVKKQDFLFGAISYQVMQKP